MFVGHGLLAFALIALAGHRLGWATERTLALAVLAGGFATLPDVDMVYAPVGLLGGASGVFAASEAFWQTGNVVHRVITHSLVVGVVAAVGFGLWATGGPTGESSRARLSSVAGLGVLGALVVAAMAVTGGLAGVIMAVFCLGGLAITTVAVRQGVGPGAVTGMALVGLLSHPFGDLLTGSPPALLYPFETVLVAERIALHPDPTLHLLGAFVVELSTFWLAGWAYCRLRDRRLHEYVSPRATVGAGYAAAVFVVPAPTLEVSAPFVFSILAVAVVGAVGLRGEWVQRVPTRPSLRADRGATASLPRVWPVRRADTPTAVLTGLTAVTVAVTVYTVTYLLF